MEHFLLDSDKEIVRTGALMCMRSIEETVKKHVKKCAEKFIQDHEEPVWFGLEPELELESVCISLVGEWEGTNTYPSYYAKTYVAAAMVGCV